ncbi:MAG TPA: hydroxysqualene dehydroxylase HpnE [Tepidisphaeraceae bacterium]|nr:hydroxysqualene dehydroxylase HpnE [Tepidisphaeraceae bacterium]
MNEPPQNNAGLRCVVIGAGLAGMAAAVALESAGVNVTLIEARRTAGGRAGSFVHPETGETLDNCQHVLLGCCTNLIDFYRRIGALDRIRFERTIHFLDGRGNRHDLWGIAELPAPLHLGVATLLFGALNNSERLALGQAMLAMMYIGREGRQKIADQSFGDWLTQHNQPSSLIDKIYQPLITGALNEDCRKASAAYAIQVFQDSLLSNSKGYMLGLPKCPLGELYANLPCRDFRLGQRVSELTMTADRRHVNGVKLTDGQAIPVDAVVLATNYDAVRRFVNAQDDPRVAPLEYLSSTPILGAHLFFDSPVLPWSHVAFLEGPLQWLFKKDSEGRSVHGVISAATDWVNRDRDEMAELFANQVRQTLPQAKDAKLLRSVIVIEKRATFAPVPGVDQWRPTQSPIPGGIENLYFAGDYTQTGWPATMEGAVRSGYLAAQSIVGRRFLVDDLPMQWPSKFMATFGTIPQNTDD